MRRAPLVGFGRRPGTSIARALTICGLTTAALALGSCGEDEGLTDLPPAVPANPATTTTPAARTQTATTKTPSSATGASGNISKDLSSKPEIPKPSGRPPTKLVVRDIVKGSGRAAKLDGSVTVHYVGVSYSTGQEFDASWNGGEPVKFTLSQGQLIDGWIEGIPGMKVGGRRMLTIPPELGYGPAGSPPAIGPNETLVFVIDLKQVG